MIDPYERLKYSERASAAFRRIGKEKCVVLFDEIAEAVRDIGYAPRNGLGILHSPLGPGASLEDTFHAVVGGPESNLPGVILRTARENLELTIEVAEDKVLRRDLTAKKGRSIVEDAERAIRIDRADAFPRDLVSRVATPQVCN